MGLFEEKELNIISKTLKKYVKENKVLADSNEFINYLKQYTDYTQTQYTQIEKTINYTLRYEDTIKSEEDIKNVMLNIEDLEQHNDGIFTKANVIVSVLSSALLLFTAVETNNVWFLVYIFYGLIWAYLSRYIGLKKGITSGYVWGYFLGIIGFIVVCVLPKEQEENSNMNGHEALTNKYEDLEKLLILKEKGAITETEFEIEKAKLLK